MVVVDFRKQPEPLSFVIRLGGNIHSLSARELARVLVDFSDSYSSLSAQLGYDPYILHVEGVVDGSIRAKYRWILPAAGGLFQELPKGVVIGVFVAFIMKYLSDDGFDRTVFEDYTEFRRGDEIYHIPNDFLTQAERIPRPDKVGSPLSRLFDRLEGIPEIINFSIEKDNEEHDPMLYIPRVDFARIRERADAEIDEREERLVMLERVRVLLVKAVFSDSGRKWDFIIDGRQWSCKINDKDFYHYTKTRKYVFGEGDELLVDLTKVEKKDASSAFWEPVEIEIDRVHDLISGA